MTVDCQWVQNKLEAFFCDQLNESESRLARMHIETCALCREEVQALNAIDPLVKGYFRQEMKIARRARVIHKGRLVGASSALAAVVALSFVFLIRTPETVHLVEPAPVPAAEGQAPITETLGADKESGSGGIIRSKPLLEPAAPVDRTREERGSIPSNAPDFLVTDPAGYTHTLDEYRGRTVVVGVWSPGDGESITNMERLYKAYAANTKLRFLGVSNQRVSKPANTTFPVLYNQGSKLFGAKSNEFVVVGENGSIELQGSFARDGETLRRVLQAK